MGDNGHTQPTLHRHFGVWQATALNVTMIVGAGIFATIPPMLGILPGPYALLGWIGAGALILVDGLIWSELGASLPGSGGTYLYLLEAFGRSRWGRLMAFLFIWQFLISGPLEVATGLIAMGNFSSSISGGVKQFNKEHTTEFKIGEWEEKPLALAFGPTKYGCFLIGVGILVLLYRRISSLGRLTVVLWIGILGAIAWILIEGWSRFDPRVAFDYPTADPDQPIAWASGLGGAMILAPYSYLGYYHVCYMGDEVREPGRTIPRAIILSALLVCVLFVGLHLAMLGTVSWRDVNVKDDNYSLAAAFMAKTHPGQDWPVALVSILLMGSCFASVFAGVLGYSRIPYAASRRGHFFAALGKIHPVHSIPHLSLFAVGGLTLLWSFFDFGSVVTALITTRIIEQFIAQIVAVVLLRRTRPDLPRPYKMWLYPLPCFLALIGWLYVYISAGWLYISLGLATLTVGIALFFLWSARTGGWPFGTASR